QPPRKFLGIPRDIDFIKNQGWAQVIVQGRDPDPLISETKNDRIQSILLLALMLKREVVVDYVEDENRPKKLTSASLSVNTKQEQGQVLMLSFDEKDNYCRAVIFYDGKTNNVWTTSAQMQGVLETAVRESIPVQQFMFDGTAIAHVRELNGRSGFKRTSRGIRYLVGDFRQQSPAARFSTRAVI